MFSVTCVCYLLLSGELRNLVGSILGGQTGSNISLEQVRMVGEREGKEGRGEGREMQWDEGRLKQITQQQEQQYHQSRAGGRGRRGRTLGEAVRGISLHPCRAFWDKLQ